MRKISLTELNDIIQKNRKQANETIYRTLHRKRRRKRSRKRSLGEIEALNEISVARWQKAVKEGKIKYLDKRKLYYDYRDE